MKKRPFVGRFFFALDKRLDHFKWLRYGSAFFWKCTAGVWEGLHGQRLDAGKLIQRARRIVMNQPEVLCTRTCCGFHGIIPCAVPPALMSGIFVRQILCVKEEQPCVMGKRHPRTLFYGRHFLPLDIRCNHNRRACGAFIYAIRHASIWMGDGMP